MLVDLVVGEAQALFGGAREQTDGGERGAAKSEEIVGGPYPLDPQHPGKKVAPEPFLPGGRCHIVGIRHRHRDDGQSLEIHLVVLREGQPWQLHICRRHHIGGQHCRQGVSHLSGSYRATGSEISTETLLAPDHTHHDRRLQYARHTRDGMLYLSRFDAVAAQFHLTVGTSHELQQSLGIPPHQVARVIDTPLSETAGGEPLRGERFVAQIALGHLRPRHP